MSCSRGSISTPVSRRTFSTSCVGTVSADEHVPNTASAVQLLLGAKNAAAMDINTACTSFLYGLTSATAMVRTGVVRNAVVIGVEGISPYMDWSNRNVAVLFGDGAAAVVIQASDRPEGVIAEKLGCYADARHTLRVRGSGGSRQIRSCRSSQRCRAPRIASARSSSARRIE